MRRLISGLAALVMSMCATWTGVALGAQQSEATRAQIPEPIAVQGWIGIVDPGSGKLWPPVQIDGYPSSVELVFRRRQESTAKASQPLRSVTFRAMAGISGTLRNNPAAWRYRYDFVHDTAHVGSPAAQGTSKVRYNPYTWRFSHVVVGSFFHCVPVVDEPGRCAASSWRVSFTPRSAPFPGLN